MSKFVATVIVLFFVSFSVKAQKEQEILQWSSGPNIPNEIGLNGSFSGIHNDALIVAGGANFPDQPVWQGGEKKWHNEIYVLTKKGNDSLWIVRAELKLPQKMAYGVSISTDEGLLCIGGENKSEVFKEVFLIKWNPKTRMTELQELPPLPVPLSAMGGALVDNIVYLTGGQTGKSSGSTTTFLSFNLTSTVGRPKYTWKVLDDFPGESRIQPVVVGQSNGHQDCLYVFSGLHHKPGVESELKMLSDVYQYDPFKSAWTKKSDVPSNQTPGIKGGYIAAAPVVAMGDSHILIFGGAGGELQHLFKRVKINKKIKNLERHIDKGADSLARQISSLKADSMQLLKSTSFSRTIWTYHTITDTWTKSGSLPHATQVVTNALLWDKHIVIAGGETSPGVRTSNIAIAQLKPYEPNFGWINYGTLIVYLLLMVMMGWFFSKRNKTTDDFFLAGGRIPWWAAGLSIYATMLSAITYLSQPALAYSFDWQTYLGYFTILLVVPVVITFYLPFYRKLNVTTAYEYLEKRFHVNVRVFASLSFVLFQLVRMGVVVYLPALALSTVVGMDIYLAIVVMGILAILYTYLGGMEAVIWTDVVQVIVLIGGLVVGLVYIVIDLGDLGYIFKTAYNDSKMQLFDWRFSTTEVVTWSLFMGSFALSFIPYTTDQAVVQRYMTTSSEKEAKKSIWLNGIIAIPAGILIFTMGTFLYVYFKEHPEYLSVGMQNDSILPLFITNHLPPGIAGLLIAGIFSASMSSLDSSMHSISTVLTVDFYKRFSPVYTDKKGLKLAKYITITVGSIGTIIACLMAAFPVRSIFFFFQEVIGLFGSAIAGIFILGIFIQRANWIGTLGGAVLTILCLVLIKYNTHINFYIYPLIGIPLCVISGSILSFAFSVKQKNLDNLIYRSSKTKDANDLPRY